MKLLEKESVQLTVDGESVTALLYLPETTVPAPALVVCHGAGDYKENYTELCEFLVAKGLAALALDMYGHGESSGNRFFVQMKHWVKDVQAGVDFLCGHPRVDPAKVGAFGMSSGGTAVLEAALLEPRLRAIIALEATVRNFLPAHLFLGMKLLLLTGKVKKALTGKDLRLNLADKTDDFQLASDPEIDRQIKAHPRTQEAGRSISFPGAAESFFVDTLKRVPKIQAPTLVLWGEDDQLDSPETARALFDALTAKKKIHIIPGNGHAGHLDRNRQQVFASTAEWALENLAA